MVQFKVHRRVQETFSINRLKLKQGQWPTDGVKESGETPRRNADSGGPDGTFPHATPKTDLEQKFKFAFWCTDCETKNEKDEIAARLTPGRKGIHQRRRKFRKFPTGLPSRH